MKMFDRAQMKNRSRLYGLLLMICLFQGGYTSQNSDGYDRLFNKLEELCLSNPAHYITNFKKCNVSFHDGICWPQTPAGKPSSQRCSYVMYSGKGTATRKCSSSLKWENLDTSNCSIVPNPGGSGQTSAAGNCSGPQTAASTGLKASDRLNIKKLYEVMTWIAIIVMVPSLVVLFLIRKERVDFFVIHMNLILALLLQCFTYFIDYYGGLSDDISTQTFCNFIWVLNQLFVAATVMWVLNEGIYLIYILKSAFSDKTSYLWYYIFLGWGFPFFLVMCVYMTTIQFTVGTYDPRCWSHYRQSPYMLVVYIPLTLVLIVNMGFLSYMVYVTSQKKRSTIVTSLETNSIKEYTRKALLWMPLLTIIYLLKFYVSESNVGFGYLLSFFYPLMGVPICLVYVVFERDARYAVRKRWYLWKYGKLPEEVLGVDGKRQYRFSDDERFRNSPFIMNDGDSTANLNAADAKGIALRSSADLKDGRSTPGSRSAKVAPAPNSRTASPSNDVMYLNDEDSENKLDSVKDAWDQKSIKQDAALDDTGEDSLPNKPELTDGDDDATKNEDEAGKKGGEDDKDGADKDEVDGAKKEDELQKNGVVKTKPRINYQAKWRGAGRAVLMSKRGFKGPPGYHMSLTAQQARAKWIVELWSGPGSQNKDVHA